MSILEQLWYGNLDPQIIPIEKGSELDAMIKESSACFDDLMSKLPEELQELYEKERELYTAANALREVEVFKQGFKYAMRIAAEVFCDENKKQSNNSCP